MRRLLTAAAACALLALPSCGDETALPADTVDYSQPVTVTFEATGSATSVDVVLVAGDERTEATDRAVPFGRYAERTTLDPLTGPTAFLGPVTLDVPVLEQVSMDVSVGPGGGDIECRILAGGKVIDRAAAAGPSATARCSARVPSDASG